MTATATAAPDKQGRGYRMRITLLKAETAAGPADPTVEFDLSLVPYAYNGRMLRLNEPTEWIELDPLLKDHTVDRFMRFMTYTPLTRLQMRVEVAQADPNNPTADGKLLRTLTEDVSGQAFVFLLPSYQVPEENWAQEIRLFSEHAQKYLEAARKVALKPSERPQRFIVSCFHLMGQGIKEQLKISAEAVAMLGFNTVNSYGWGSLPISHVDATLDANGLQRRATTSYNPPSYFHFERDKMNPQELAKWAKETVNQVQQSGGRPADLALVGMADEPGWYFPGSLNRVNSKPENLETFHVFLRGKGFQPVDLGGKEWKDIQAIGAGGAKDLPTRRLYYWSVRFFTESSGHGFKMAREAIEKELRGPVKAYVNYGNFSNLWYTASPNKIISNNNLANADSAMGGVDWFFNGRLGAHTTWSEDWFSDQQAQYWSQYTDMLRCAAMLGSQQDYGAYTVGGLIGDHPAGGIYKMLAQVGHGAKILDVYTWGPAVYMPGDAWSESWRSYKPIADALRLVGRGERLLYPGRRERGKVAIQVPNNSALWENDLHTPHYILEMHGLHHALTHAGYTIDFVDDVDLAEGALSSRGYSAFYLLGPNLAQKAQEKLRDWVQAGGTVVVLPGGGAADEYNTPTVLLDNVLGLTNRTSVRTATISLIEPHPVTGTVLPSDIRFGASEMELRGPVRPLEVKQGRALAKFKSGDAAITANAFGKGRAIAYGFYPGWQYWLSPDRTDKTRLPLNWSATARKLIATPARIANTPRPVITSVEGVEACRLQSDKGIAVVLLNWTDTPIQNLTLTLSNTSNFRKVSSLERGVLKGAITGNSMKVSLPLQNVDVLMIE